MGYAVTMHGPVMVIEFFGTVTIDDLGALERDVRAHESALGHAPDRIVDSTRVQETVLRYDVLASLARRRERELPPNRYRVVFVEATQAGYGIARMYEQLAQYADVEIRMVATRREADALLLTGGGGAAAAEVVAP